MKRIYRQSTVEERARHDEIREQIEKDKPEIAENDRIRRRLTSLEEVSKRMIEIAEANGVITESELEPLKKALANSEK